jgi:hypothetical protein
MIPVWTCEQGRRPVDPLVEYYLCVKDGETMMMAAPWWENAAMDEFDTVQQLTFSQAMQLTVALMELDRPTVQVPDLYSLTAFMGADEELIEALFANE